MKVRVIMVALALALVIAAVVVSVTVGSQPTSRYGCALTRPQRRAGMSGDVLVAAASLAVLSLLAFAVSLFALCEIGQGAGA
jgi:hypothetical protein